MQLPLEIRLKLIRQEVLAALRIGGARRVAIAPAQGGVDIVTDGRVVRAPSPWRWKLYRQGFEARLDRLEREYGVGRHVRLKPGDVIIDVGANAGEFAFVAARYGARIFCIEPDPKVFACLEANIARLESAQARDMVIWKSDGEIAFGLAPDRADSSVFAANAPQVTKRALTLASFAGVEGLACADFLKCDAEGAEPEVLEGAGAFLTRIRAVALDTGPERQGQPTDKACGEILARAGFRVIDEAIGGRRMTYGINLREM